MSLPEPIIEPIQLEPLRGKESKTTGGAEVLNDDLENQASQGAFKYSFIVKIAACKRVGSHFITIDDTNFFINFYSFY